MELSLCNDVVFLWFYVYSVILDVSGPPLGCQGGGKSSTSQAHPSVIKTKVKLGLGLWSVSLPAIKISMHDEGPWNLQLRVCCGNPSHPAFGGIRRNQEEILALGPFP